MNSKKLLWIVAGISSLGMQGTLQAQERKSTETLRTKIEQLIKKSKLAQAMYQNGMSKPMIDIPKPSKGSIFKRSIEIWNKTDTPISVALIPLSEIPSTMTSGQLLGEIDKIEKALRNPANLKFAKLLNKDQRYEIDTVDANDATRSGEPLTSYDPKLNVNKDAMVLFALIDPKKGDAAELKMYVFKPRKTIYVRFKTEGGKVILGPQTGPLMGFMGETETHYPLKNNIQNNDFIEIKI